MVWHCFLYRAFEFVNDLSLRSLSAFQFSRLKPARDLLPLFHEFRGDFRHEGSRFAACPF